MIKLGGLFFVVIGLVMEKEIFYFHLDQCPISTYPGVCALFGLFAFGFFLFLIFWGIVLMFGKERKTR